MSVTLPAYGADEGLLGMHEHGWAITFDTGYQHQFDADIDGGGEMNVDRFGVRGTFDLWKERSHAFSLSLGYTHHDYDFSGNRGVGQLDPWEGVNEFSVTAPMRFTLSPCWSMLFIPALYSTTESGADFGDGLSASASTMFVYRVNENLKIGPGVAVSSRIEDGARVLPLIYVEWQITDTLNLKTGPGDYLFAAPGATLTYTPCGNTAYFIGVGLERLRFRLDDDPIAPEGVGEESSIPVAIGVTHRFNTMTKLCINGGVKFAGEIEIDDDDGNNVREEDFDPVPFLGLSLELKF